MHVDCKLEPSFDDEATVTTGQDLEPSSDGTATATTPAKWHGDTEQGRYHNSGRWQWSAGITKQHRAVRADSTGRNKAASIEHDMRSINIKRVDQD